MIRSLMGILAGLELLARRIPAVSSTQEWQLLNEQAARIDELLRTYQDLFAGGPVERLPFPVDQTVRRAVSRRSRSVSSRSVRALVSARRASASRRARSSVSGASSRNLTRRLSSSTWVSSD